MQRWGGCFKYSRLVKGHIVKEQQGRYHLKVAPTAEKAALPTRTSLSFPIEGFLLNGDSDRPTGRVVWGGKAPETADDLTSLDELPEALQNG
jgi:hypothetical protein